MNTITVTRENGDRIGAHICSHIADGYDVKVNGREVWNKYRRQAVQVWGNGTVEVSVRGRKNNSQGSVFAKLGETLTIEIA